MQDFFVQCEVIWMSQPPPSYWLKYFYNESQARLFPGGMNQRLRSLLQAAETAAANSPKHAARVRLVSIAFGVTERLAHFQEAREKLARESLLGHAAASGTARSGPSPPSDGIAEALARYLAAKTEFLSYIAHSREQQPLAIARFEPRDFLKNDPAVSALAALAAIGRAAGGRGSAPDTLAFRNLPGLPDGWESVLEASGDEGPQLVRDGNLAGPTAPALRIAGLEYGLELPAAWFGRTEPVQTHRSQLLPATPPGAMGGTGSGRVVRITGAKDTSVSQWNSVESAAFHIGSVQIRGRVSPGSLAVLTFGWLDGTERNIGFSTMRLPEGDWPEWQTLHQGAKPPPDARWIGIGIRIEHQAPGDWVEAGSFRLHLR
jgi:hypothetical protein